MSLVTNERTKLTAAYLNTAAGSLFTAGVVAPIVAAVFGVTGPSGGVPTLTLGLGAMIFLCASIALHAAARYVRKGLKP
ncbi:hypothetical protein [Methylobacterium platani]|uniref:Amino acid transporter protein n=2 Tax=Methylobacterium platani TaxID=427683 RepID=A0A179S901_9HYPH|nr:hypothetical protein [Methylobacterium platani]KMO19533.1 hypothetical protein SQ03_07685 [Methylobacterium platani JCM 14648]OAS24021.1 hypothetical protein A5481_14715 [Methylobacterium platani]